MNRTSLALLVFGFGLLFGLGARAADSKTDPARDVFIENSTTNFVLVAGSPKESANKRFGFDLAAPTPGDYTLVCFIGGKFWKVAKFASPGTFELSIRGMPPGFYQITLQLIDSQDRVGTNTQIIQVN